MLITERSGTIPSPASIIIKLDDLLLSKGISPTIFDGVEVLVDTEEKTSDEPSATPREVSGVVADTPKHPQGSRLSLTTEGAMVAVEVRLTAGRLLTVLLALLMAAIFLYISKK
jgi:hypothetical protein